MFRSFRVSNHKSFRDEAELLLLPAYDKSRDVVPVAGILGANASGKSNLLDALRWLQRAVRESYAHWEPGAGVPRTPFRLDPDYSSKPSLYCVEIIVDGSRHTYGLEVDDQRVLTEWLYTYPHNRKRLIFEREQGKVRLGSTVSDYRARGEQLARQTRDNALFLSVAAHNGLGEAGPLYEWFRTATQFPDGTEVAGKELLRRLGDERQRSAIVEMVSAADLGIRDITGLYETIENHQELRGGRLRFHHGKSRVPLALEDQSAGTRSWIGLVSSALDVIAAGDLLVIDEIDASLHPYLSALLISLFRESDSNLTGAQLLFTTHDPTLLDEDTLARDEVWFVEKDPESGVSTLFPLTDFRPRKQENRVGRYLAGGYGAVPVVSDQQVWRALRGGESDDAAA